MLPLNHWWVSDEKMLTPFLYLRILENGPLCRLTIRSMKLDVTIDKTTLLLSINTNIFVKWLILVFIWILINSISVFSQMRPSKRCHCLRLLWLLLESCWLSCLPPLPMKSSCPEHLVGLASKPELANLMMVFSTIFYPKWILGIDPTEPPLVALF